MVPQEDVLLKVLKYQPQVVVQESFMKILLMHHVHHQFMDNQQLLDLQHMQ